MASSNPTSNDALLETLIPGYSLFARVVSVYLAVSFAFALFVVPLLVDHLQQFFLYFAASVEINYHDVLYRQLMHWVSNHRSLSKTQHSIAGTKTDYVEVWGEDEVKAEENEFENQQLDFETDEKKYWQRLSYMNKMKPIRCTPTQDTLHFFTYKGSLIAFRRSPRSSRYTLDLANAENITLYTTPWNREALRELLHDIQEVFLERECDRITIYRGVNSSDSTYWQPAASNYPRSMSTVILDENKKNALLSDIKNFLAPKTRAWYRSHCYPYRRGFLFHGPPGTGKSSMCFAIASLLRLDIYTVSFNSRLNEDGFSNLLHELPRRCLLLFEDIDTAGVQKRNFEPEEDEPLSDEEADMFHGDHPRRRQSGGISLSSLLNAIDGIGAQEGRILIMTTNCKKSLDPALLRPGRVDMEVSFGFVDQAAIQQVFLAFYVTPDEVRATKGVSTVNDSYHTCDGVSPDAKNGKNDITSLAIEFSKHVPSGKFTPADIQNYLFEHRETPETAVEGIREWVKKKQGASKSSE
ncbi:hypothetical protein PRK78_000084 [Emydomyces testavorans]|uniref:Uncharacterized protein n=1 Tax=Emydomyces testavorans TaxID=2070801 RepID=A0AAF0DAS5_9EURO|nr:hypothetical protein PRK78_000084 [Emydomyces testavorans]